MVNKVIFTINSNFNGNANYYIYEGFGCSGSTITYSGSTTIINGSSNVIIDNINVSEELSIKVIDFGNCDECFDYSVENIVQCTPFTGSATYVEPTEQIYYILDACDESQPPYSTLIEPFEINQRYILPGPTNYFYIWNGVTSNENNLHNTSIQIISGEYGCPS
jgi:hypothetical protein